LLVVYDEKYWKSIINFDGLIENGVVSKSDINNISFCNSVDDAFKLITSHFDKHYSKEKENVTGEPKIELK
jgi:hypothetical protein